MSPRNGGGDSERDLSEVVKGRQKVEREKGRMKQQIG